MHRFWSTQPVSTSQSVGPIEIKDTTSIRKTPLQLLDGFYWSELDLDNPGILEECYQLLSNHYVADDSEKFRFDYSRDFLKWALQPPGWKLDWLLGVRNNGKLLAMITAIPVMVGVHSTEVSTKVPMVEINFLCVHKKLRGLRLAPVLIKEITRRVNLMNIWQAINTSGVKRPTPFASARYWHRALNPNKLIKLDFMNLGPRQTLSRLNRLLKLSSDVITPGWRAVRLSDINQLSEFINREISKFKIHPIFSIEDIMHWFMPQKGIISSFVIENSSGEITDFGSYFHLNSNVENETLNACYSWYNFGSLKEVMNNLLIEANKDGCDVFNALNIMNNSSVFEDLKFNIGDGNLYYFFFNWDIGIVDSKDVGVVLV